MWKFLHKWLSTTTAFGRGAMDTEWAEIKYTGLTMHEYLAKWKWCSAQSSPLDAPMDEGLQVTIFTETVGDNSKSPYGAALSALLKMEDRTWQAATLQLVQESRSQNVTNSSSFPSEESAYVASYSKT